MSQIDSLDILNDAARSSEDANFAHFARYIQNCSAFMFERGMFKQEWIEWWNIQTFHAVSQFRNHIIYCLFNAFVTMWTVDLTRYCSRCCK